MLINGLVRTAGVVGSNDMLVTAQAAPNMSVRVAIGAAFVKGTVQTYQGMYHCFNDGTVNVSLSASDPSNPRIDLIVLRIYDADVSGVTNTCALEVVTGTASSSPVAGAVGNNALVLAQVAVAASASTVTTGNITDSRVRATSAIQQIGALENGNEVQLRVQAGSGQSLDILRVLNDGGTNVVEVASTGKITARKGLRVNGPLDGSTGNFTLDMPLSTATDKGLLIKGASSATGDLTQWQNSSSTVLGSMSALGEFFSTRSRVTNTDISLIPSIVQAASGQSTDIAQWNDHTAAQLASLSNAGRFTAVGYNVSGDMDLAKPSFVSVYRTSVQTLGSSGNYKRVTWDGEAEISNAAMRTGNQNRIIAPYTGWYQCTAQVVFSDNSSDPDRACAVRIVKNADPDDFPTTGAVLAWNRQFIDADDNTPVLVSQSFKLNAGDYIEVYARAFWGSGSVEIRDGSGMSDVPDQVATFCELLQISTKS